MAKARKYKRAYDQIKVAISEGMSFNDALSDVCSKFQLTDRTFANYWKDAKEEYKEQQEAIKKEVLRDAAEKEKEANRAHLYDKGSKAEELMQDVAAMRAEIRELRKVTIGAKMIGSGDASNIIVTTQSDVNGAKRAISQLQRSINQSLDILARWYGYNEPEKIDGSLTVNEGFDLSKLSDEAAEEWLLATGRIK